MKPLTLWLVALLTISACTRPGSVPSPTVPPGTTTTTAGTTTTTIQAAEAIDLYETCLADRGVDIEPIPFDALGRPRLELVMRDIDFTDPDSSAALTACAGHLSTGALDLTRSPILQERVGVLLADFSACVREHGVSDFPEPIPGFAGIGGPFPLAEIPFSDPKLSDAVALCRDRLGAVTR